MTTSATATVIDHTSDAAFRAWGAEFAANLAAVGLVQTADTGQINWVTVTRPAVGVAGGYEIWRFADSTYYLKIEYGTASASATAPAMWEARGTGSNGTGTLTGQLTTRSLFTGQAVPTSTGTAYTSRWCHVADAFAVSWKEGYATTGNTNGGLLVVGKAVNGSGGALTTGGAVLRSVAGTGSVSIQTVRDAATAATFNDVASNIIVPGDPNTSSTASTGNQQAYQIPINIPDVLPFNWACVVLLTEAPRSTTILVAIVGVGTHTYYSVGSVVGGSTFGQYTAGRYCPAMIYE